MDFVKCTIESIEPQTVYQGDTWSHLVRIITPSMALTLEDTGGLVEDAKLKVGEEAHLLLKTSFVYKCVVVDSLQGIPKDGIWHRRHPNEGIRRRLLRARDIDYVGAVVRRAYLRDCIRESRFWNRAYSERVFEARSPDVVLTRTDFGLIAVEASELPDPYQRGAALPENVFLGCLGCGPLRMFAIF